MKWHKIQWDRRERDWLVWDRWQESQSWFRRYDMETSVDKGSGVRWQQMRNERRGAWAEVKLLCLDESLTIHPATNHVTAVDRILITGELINRSDTSCKAKQSKEVFYEGAGCSLYALYAGDSSERYRVILAWQNSTDIIHVRRLPVR